MTEQTETKNIFSKTKKYKLRIKLSDTIPMLTFRNATITDESQHFVMIKDARDGTTKGYAKTTILNYEEEQ